jgi:hypothetical protein
MSIEQKIAEMLAESKKLQESTEEVVAEEAIEEVAEEVVAEEAVAEPNAKNNVDDQDGAIAGAPAKKANEVTKGASAPEASNLKKSVKEDVDALLNGEELSEEFKQKAETIFEAAVVTRVKEEVARLEEEFDTKLAEQVQEIKEGLVEQVDGYLGYIAEQWIAQNEIALEAGMKSEILESFVEGLKGVFEQHYIEVPEEKFDVLGEMQEKVEALEAKLNEQVEANVALTKTVNEQKRASAIAEAADGLTDTEVEKFSGLAEELSFEDVETFTKKLQTIRENYFTKQTNLVVESVVSDTPVLTEEVKHVDPAMKRYLSVFDSIKK